MIASHEPLSMGIVLLSGQVQRVFIRFREESVALEYAPQRLVVMRHLTLRLWLSNPVGPLIAAGIAGFVVHHTAWGPKVALKIPDADVWPLSPRDLAILRERV